MKKLIILLLTLTLILGVFVSCDNSATDDTSGTTNQETNAETTTETTLPESFETTNITTDTEEASKDYAYTVEKIDGKWYMIWDNYWDGEFNNSAIHYETVYVDSIDALKNAIPNGDLGKDASIFFMKYVNVNTYTRIPIYDIDHIWQPTTPDSLSAVHPDMIALYPGSYSFQAWYVEHPEWLGISSPAYTIEVLPKESYESSYEADNQLLISNGWSKKELRDGEKMLTIYSCSGESPRVEDVILHSYCIYATNGQYYGTIDTTLDHELTDEELLEFGFEEYFG